MQLKLLTFNTLGTPFFAPNIAKRYNKAAELISASDVEVVCLQELFSHYNRMLFDRYLKDFPYKIYKQFSLGLSGGLAIYSKIPLEFVSFHKYTYPNDINVPFYTMLARSGILVAKFKDAPLYLATTHLASDVVHDVAPKDKLYKLIRTQLDQAAESLNHVSGSSNILLAGDFNISKESELYEEFLKKTHAQDLFKNDHTPSYANDRIPYIYPAKTNKRIDYMFYKGSKPLKIEKKEMWFQEKVEDKGKREFYLSDHSALFASLNI